MRKHIPLLGDLRRTATTSAALAIAARTRGDGTTVPFAAIEAGIVAAAPFLADALHIQDAIDAATEPAAAGGQQRRRLAHRLWRRAHHNPYAYLRLLQQHGMLSLRTVQLDDDRLSIHEPARGPHGESYTGTPAGRRSRRRRRKRGRFAAPAHRRR